MRKSALFLAAAILAFNAQAGGAAGVFKVVTGNVSVQRGEQRLPASVGMQVQVADVIRTGKDGSAGLVFQDNSLLSLGPASRLVVDHFSFDSTTHDGQFETTLARGKLAVVSGKIAKHQLDAMKVYTPTSILGIRGTEFVVEAEGKE
ncbi:MAG: FecR domain-containing protein [Pseudomonadota bacterium]